MADIRKFIAKVRETVFIVDAPRREHASTVVADDVSININLLLFSRIEDITYQFTSNTPYK